MDIKMIHEMVEKLTECAKSEMDKKGIEEIDTEEFGEVTDIIKDLSEAMYYRTLTEAMKESEYGEDYDYMGAYDEYERKGYRGQRRDSRGRYMSRRGYVHYMMPEMDWDDMEYQRDMDRPYGRMGYSSGGSSMGGSSSMSGGHSSGSMGSSGGNRGYSDGGRDMREGRSGQSRRGYMESKEMHKGNSAEDKQQKMKELEHYMKDLSEDVTEMISEMSPEEKSLMKQKMSVLMQKIG
jgi:hypothetical protein